MIKTIIEVTPHDVQRYPTVGDYTYDDLGTTHIRVSQIFNEDYEFLIGLHEYVEEYLTRKHEIQEVDIREFDIEFERVRKPGDKAEPGDDPGAPYFFEHQFATKIEMMLAAELGVEWHEYSEACDSLYNPSDSGGSSKHLHTS